MKKIIALLMCLCLVPLCALAEDGSWIVGVWTAESIDADGEAVDMRSVFGDAKVMIVAYPGGQLKAVRVYENGLDVTDNRWKAYGLLVKIGDDITMRRDGDKILAFEYGDSVVFRSATEEERALLRGEMELPAEAFAAPEWLLGEWVYQYSMADGVRESILEMEGDYARVTFMADGSYRAETCIGGEVSSEILQYEMRPGGWYGNDERLELLPSGLLMVGDPDARIFLARPEAQGAEKEEGAPETETQHGEKNSVASAPAGQVQALTGWQ